MKCLSYRFAIVFSFAAVALLLTGVAQAQPTNQTLAGTYIVTSYFNDSVDESSTSLSRVTFDGVGAGVWDVLANSQDDIGSGSLTYTVNPDGSFMTSVEGELLRGIIAPDGEILTAVELDPDDFGFYAAMRMSSGLTNADLSGTYILVQYLNDAVDGVSTAFSSVTFDGNGGGLFDIQVHSQGEIGMGPFTYALEAEGTLTITADGSTLRGVFNPVAGALTLVELDPEVYGLYVGMRTSAGHTAMSLDGVYEVGQYQRNGAAVATHAAFTFDGAGAGDREPLQTSEGTGVGGSFSYAVDDDGTFTITGAAETHGIVAPDGSWFVFAEVESLERGLSMGFRRLETGTAREANAPAPALALTVGPNPAHGTVFLRFDVPRSAPVRLEVFDMLGRQRAVLVDASLSPGPQVIPWETAGVEAGSYLFRLTVDEHVVVQPGMVF